MGLKKIVKALLWFGSAPLTRWRFLQIRPVLLAASGLHRTAVLSGSGEFSFSSGLVVGRRTRLHADTGGCLSMGPNVWVGDDCEISAEKKIGIGTGTSLQNRSIVLGDVALGAGCVCAPNLYISSAWHHFQDEAMLPVRWQDARAYAESSGVIRSRPVHIGEDCWIGINVVILPGVRIGRGCVIGANSVVTSDLPAYCVAGGTPAKVIRQRLTFSPPTMLDASDPAHLPYFYRGFSMWEPGVTDVPSALRNGGWMAEGPFALAVSIPAGAKVVLTVHCEVAGELGHNGFAMPVAKGFSKVAFTANPSNEGLLEFSWSSRSGQGIVRIAIIAAEQVSD